MSEWELALLQQAGDKGAPPSVLLARWMAADLATGQNAHDSAGVAGEVFGEMNRRSSQEQQP